MPTFVIFGTAHVSVYKEIEAATEDEARAKAELLDMPRLCHQCPSESRSTWELSDGLGEYVELSDKEEESPDDA